MSTDTMLSVEDLAIHYATGSGPVQAVDGVSFDIKPGEALGLVGESGCGKTTAAKSMLRLLPPNGETPRGSIDFQGRNLLDLDEEGMRRVRWKDIAWISQAAMNALDPVYKVGDQIVEAMQAHISISKAAAWAHGEELFRQVGIDPDRLSAYPHEMSGGMKQRAVIAMALALDPKLIVADEPTTALDVVTQAQILARLSRLRRERGLALMFITHDISVVVQTCDRVAVMYGGHIMETGPVRTVFGEPFHPYTMGLTNAFPTLEGAQRELISIPGAPPNLLNPPAGCRFAERCPFATDRCRSETPALQDVGEGRQAACHYPERAAEFRVQAMRNDTWQVVGERLGEYVQTGVPLEKTQSRDNLMQVNKLTKEFDVDGGLLSSLPWRKSVERKVHAVDNISFDLYQGEVLGLAGESGSGKTTTGEMLVRLQDPTSGDILFDGQNIAHMQKGELKQFRRSAQMMFQDPYQTLNPRFTIYEIVSEPVYIHKLEQDEDAVQKRVRLALERAGLKPAETYWERYPHELSGGQRQRVAIARAIVTEPRFIVADEPVSMLDVSIRAGVLNLMRRFRDEMGISFVYVSHDLPTISYVTDRTAIMYLGQIVEIGPTEAIVRERKHPYTQLLMDASPEPDPSVVKPPLESAGEIPSAVEPPNGCHFHTRCPHAMAHCGWEGRDVLTALSEWRIAGHNITALGPAKVDGLDVVFKPADDAGVEAMQEEVTAIMRARHESLVQAADFVPEAGTLRIRFQHIDSPQHRLLATDHSVACYLYD
ncbi:MAG: ABC transporter ATP-binding protein [Natronospirillum sp.]|nr:ABC transporter ATP-binding protein [Natronospirillum sp.]